MTVEEAKTILGRIKIHYPEFSKDKAVQQEWIKELILYDVEDVTKKLESHMRNEDYGDKLPKLFFLTKHLVPSLEKNKIKHYTVYCSKCGYEIPDVEFEKHTKRCIEVSTIVRDLKKYFYQNIQKKKLLDLTDDEFEKLYMEYVNKMLESDRVESFRKKILMHIKYPEYSSDDIDEIIKEMVVKKGK